MRRFVINCKCSVKKTDETQIGFLSTQELSDAEKCWLVNVQRRTFNDELNRLKAGELVRRNSSLVTLSPFLDSDGLIRVGGRLGNALLEYQSKHPVVLPSKDPVTTLIFRYEHVRHIGLQALLAHVSTRLGASWKDSI